MKKRIISIVAIVIVILIAGFFIIRNYWVDEKKKIQFSQERVFNISLDTVGSIPVGFSCSKLSELGDTALLLENNNEKSITIIDTSGKILLKMGNEGEGPAEFKMISSLDADTSGIFATDAVKHSISKFDWNGNLISNYSLPRELSRAVRVKQEEFLIQSTESNNKEGVLSFIWTDGISQKVNKEGLFADVFPAKGSTGLIYDGFFARNTNGSIVYTCYQTNDFFGVDRDLNLLFKAKFVYSTPLPVINETGDIKFIESSYIGVSSVSVDSKYIYVMTNIGDKKHPGTRIIDMYDLVNGKYSSSFAAPVLDGEIPSDMYKGKDLVYFVYQNRIVKFKPSFLKS